MSRSLSLVASSFAVAGLLVAGCGAATGGPVGPRADRLEPTVLYPMLPGSQWVYDVDTGGGEPPTFGAFEVIAAEGDTRVIANNRGMGADGRVSYADERRYRITAEGIQHVGSGGWVLRAPIAPGAEWEGLGGRTARVTNIDAEVEVIAGNYAHCVEVTESGGRDGRVVRTVYCPEIGPVIVESRMSSELTMRTAEASSRLRSYDAGEDDPL